MDEAGRRAVAERAKAIYEGRIRPLVEVVFAPFRWAFRKATPESGGPGGTRHAPNLYTAG